MTIISEIFAKILVRWGVQEKQGSFCEAGPCWLSAAAGSLGFFGLGIEYPDLDGSKKIGNLLSLHQMADW
jgi:hypothetical protein